MSIRENLEFLSLKLGCILPEGWKWCDVLPIIENIVTGKNAYFIFKIDGERDSKKYTFVIRIWNPLDEMIRIDTDEIEEGLLQVLSRICELKEKYNEDLFR